MNRFLSICGDDGRMDMSTFYSVMIEFATQKRQNLSDQDETKLRQVLNHLFRMFDTNNDSTVDAAELLAGLSALVGGKRDDKTKIALCCSIRLVMASFNLKRCSLFYWCIVLSTPQSRRGERVGNLTERELAVKTAQEAFERQTRTMIRNCL